MSVSRGGRLALFLTLTWPFLPSGWAQNGPSGAERKKEPMSQERLVERQAFQSQQLITARPNAWVFPPGKTPRIVWRDAETVRRLGFRGPLTVRWFDAELKESPRPDRPGRWCAWVTATAPNGLPFRRAFTFYVPPKDIFGLVVPETTIKFPHATGAASHKVWQEHEVELSRISTNLLRRNFADSEASAVVLSGLGEMKARGRPARFVESVRVLNEDYHLALKLKVLGLQDKVRKPQAPRKRVSLAPVLRKGLLCEAGVDPGAKERIDAVCREWAEATGEPFVALVARRGVIVTHEAFGQDKSGTAIDRDYRCWVASISKSVTALLFSRFVDQGLIRLDDPVSAVFPGYPQDKRYVPTFRQCFTHTSGLSGHGAFGGFRHTHLENVVLNGIDVNEPGVKYQYCGLGFDLAVKAMEITSGQSGVRLYDDHLFRPLGLGDVRVDNGSSDVYLTARELATLGQLIANRGSYGGVELFSTQTFAEFLPRPLCLDDHGSLREEGVGLHWVRHRKSGAPRNSLAPEDQLFSKMTVGYGSFSGCIFMIDVEKELVVVQVRRKTGPEWGAWAARFFQTVAESVNE